MNDFIGLLKRTPSEFTYQGAGISLLVKDFNIIKNRLMEEEIIELLFLGKVYIHPIFKIEPKVSSSNLHNLVAIFITNNRIIVSTDNSMVTQYKPGYFHAEDVHFIEFSELTENMDKITPKEPIITIDTKTHIIKLLLNTTDLLTFHVEKKL